MTIMEKESGSLEEMMQMKVKKKSLGGLIGGVTNLVYELKCPPIEEGMLVAFHPL